MCHSRGGCELALFGLRKKRFRGNPIKVYKHLTEKSIKDRRRLFSAVKAIGIR